MSFWSPHIAAIVQIRRNAKDGIFVRAIVPYLVVKGVPLSGVSATSRSLSYSARPTETSPASDWTVAPAAEKRDRCQMCGKLRTLCSLCS